MKPIKPIIVAGILLTLPEGSFAYVGPGAGLSALGTVLAFIGAVLLLIVGFLWYPIKRLIKKNAPANSRGQSDTSSNDSPSR